jgi:glycosyltransferase involved in cell wall biosynthesis
MKQMIAERPAVSRTIRLACVQGGDYWTTKQKLEGGGGEFYSGQRYTVGAYERFVQRHPHLIVSLDAPRYAHDEGQAYYRGVPRPLASRLVPRRVSEWLRSQQIIRELERFDATHLIVRCNDLVGCELLRWAIRHKVQTAGIMASRFGREHRFSRHFCELANSPHVALMANHNRVATASMIECGLDADKAIAWDMPPAVTPHDFSSKQLPSNGVKQILFAGRVCEEKGTNDLIAACVLARANGQPLKLVICGDGPLLPVLRNHPGVREGWLELAGLRQNSEVHALMRSSTVTVVPSRHDFAEGLPLVIYESLATRTPLILSDHPIFVRYFQDGVGIRYFHGADPISLKNQLCALTQDAAAYARLSHDTAAVWETLECPTKFEDILTKLAVHWNMDDAGTPTHDQSSS